MKCMVLGCRRKVTGVYVATVSRRAVLWCDGHMEMNMKQIKEAAKKHFKSTRTRTAYLKSVERGTGHFPKGVL